MSRIEDSFKILRGIEKGEPMSTANPAIEKMYREVLMLGAGVISTHIPLKDFLKESSINDGGGEHY